MDKIVALAGNPNVGKSTIFNALTGLRQHTGNWTGKTVECAKGTAKLDKRNISVVDLPGCYSLLSHSEEEEIARDFLCFSPVDCVIVVCDATCLERNLNLALQIMEMDKNVILCVNLIDEAKKKNIKIDLNKLSGLLGIPVVASAARSGKGVYETLKTAVYDSLQPKKTYIHYPEPIENELENLISVISPIISDKISPRWAAIRLLLDDIKLSSNIIQNDDIKQAVFSARLSLKEQGYNKDKLYECIAESFVKTSEKIASQVVSKPKPDKTQLLLDRIFTGKYTAFPFMLLLLLLVFFITMKGANVPSGILSDMFFSFQEKLLDLAIAYNVPDVVYKPLIFGVYRVLSWVVSVMLPPMAIFFPLFTLLEDFGYLPRVAFNLDRFFHSCHASGKQALTMCMGFGCNAVGVTGCRIIDSPRERMIAILTNSFIPCNGRFPTLFAMITLFLAGSSSLAAASILTIIIVLGIFMSLLCSKLLSNTLLKGMPSSFTLELPSYRKPQLLKVIVRSILDKTIFVLARAVIVAAPAGLIIWLFANININDLSVLQHCALFLDPFAKLIGLDGVILMAFILGLPANEIVLPIMLMTYLSTGMLTEMQDMASMRELLIQNGWTWITAVNVMLFSLMHWPCATTCLTIKKETGSIKWTLISMLIPTIMGIIICFTFTRLANLLF